MQKGGMMKGAMMALPGGAPTFVELILCKMVIMLHRFYDLPGKGKGMPGKGMQGKGKHSDLAKLAWASLFLCSTCLVSITTS